METQSLMTRIGFCQRCHDNNRPYDSQLMLLCGSHGFHVDTAHPGHIPPHPLGYTPHLYKFMRQQGNLVICKTVCCINGCDITLTKLPDGKYEFLILESKWKEIDLLVSDWNALTRYKRDLNYII